MKSCFRLLALLLLCFLATQEGCRAQPASYSVCTWNVRNFGITSRRDSKGRLKQEMKPQAEVNALVAILKRLNPDILGLNEIVQDPNNTYLRLLRQKLEETGLKYPYHASTIGEDDRIQNVLLSKFPIREDLSNNSQAYSVNRRNRQTGELYPLKKRMERGLVNCLIEVTPACRVRVLLVHLKSPLPVFGLQGDKPCEAGDEIIRRNEALIVRAAINDLLDKEPDARLVVMGDFNDNLRSKSLQTIRGGGLAPAKRLTALDLPDFLGEYWTHFYAPEREYTQIDHILVSPVLLRELCRQQSFVYRAQPGDGMELDPASASDHRPVYAVFLVPR